VRLLPVVDVLPHGSLLALIALLGDQPVKDAFSGVPLFGRRLLIRFQPGVDQGPDGIHHRPRSRSPLLVLPGRRSRPGNRLPHHASVVVLLAGNGPNALLLAVVGASNLFNLVHCQHSYPPLPRDRLDPRVAGLGSQWGQFRPPLSLQVGPLSVLPQVMGRRLGRFDRGAH